MLIDPRFSVHNAHLELANTQKQAIKNFITLDPNLRWLKRQPYEYFSPLIKQLPTEIPGIYTLGGGRQIGKTTLLKQWMLLLLEKGIPPQSIAFFSGELIDDQHALLHLIQNQMTHMPNNALNFLIIDEITYIRDWDKGIKYAADAGWFEKTIVILTGSDLVLMEEARMRFPGRRGKAEQVNFHYYPLSFHECVVLKNPDIHHKIDPLSPHFSESILHLLSVEFNHYLLHGGYLTAINDLAASGEISAATFMTYSDWIRGDMLKRGRLEHYVREILMALIKRYNSQVTWNTLAQDLSIEHPTTVADYVSTLASMDAVFIQSALLEDKLTAAPKKPRKLIFTDPFIYHALKSWLFPAKNIYQSVKESIENPILCSQLAEACASSHYRRFFPTYYIKAEGEVDIAYIDHNKFWPIEIKWTNQLRPKDFKQIQKYSNSKIFTKSLNYSHINGIPTEPLVAALFKLTDMTTDEILNLTRGKDRR